jgi:hypothetical protein
MNIRLTRKISVPSSKEEALRRKRSSLLEENLLPESIEALKRNQDV